MDVKLLIFDFDGTIMDTRRTIVYAKQETMRTMELEVFDEETCASTIGLSAKIGFEKLYPEMDEKQIDDMVVLYRDIFEKAKETMPPVLFQNVTECLEKLQQKGYELTIATSRNTKSIHEFLDKFELNKIFKYVLGGDDTKLLKPNPEPVFKTLEDLNYKPEETMVIGDMPFDIMMGKGAGVLTLGVTYGNASRNELLESGADYVIDDIKELLDVLEN